MHEHIGEPYVATVESHRKSENRIVQIGLGGQSKSAKCNKQNQQQEYHGDGAKTQRGEMLKLQHQRELLIMKKISVETEKLKEKQGTPKAALYNTVQK